MTDTVGYLGRYKKHGSDYSDYFTYHKLAGWITYTQKGWLSFNGDETKKLVDQALFKTFGEPQNLNTLDIYYYAVRAHKANSLPINSLALGVEVLAKYQELLEHAFDYDDVIHQATWFLSNQHVSHIRRFRFSHIILLDAEALTDPKQKHIQLFYESFKQWCEQHKISISDREGVII